MPTCTPTELFETIPITEETLKSDYLFGIRLEDENGDPFPPSMFRTAINYAIAYLQRYIDVCILPTAQDELHDYVSEDWLNWVYLPPDKIPILEVESVTVEFPLDVEVIAFPNEWITFDPLRRVSIVPRGGASLAAVFIGAGQVLLPLLFGGARRVPDLVRLKYTAGFRPGEIPADILHAISLLAAIQILHPAGDLIIGAGISNEELALNALRQKIETTSSPTNAGFGARIINYKNELKELMTLLREYYQGFRMSVA
jgi:hypothetical protein